MEVFPEGKGADR